MPEENDPLLDLARKSMPVDTVGDLIEVLQKLPVNTPVMSRFDDPIEVACVNFGLEGGVFLGFIAIRERDEDDERA